MMMKLNSKAIILFSGLILLSTLSYAQGKKIDVLLTVDVDNITQENMEETCSFGQPEDVSNEDFTTNVQVADEVKWKISRLDGSRGSAKLVKYKHDRGNRFFGKDTIPQKNGNIKGIVSNEAGEIGAEEKYSLGFKVKKRGESDWTYYMIDPKLKLIPRD